MKEQFVDLHVKEGLGELYAYYDSEIWFSYNDFITILDVYKPVERYIIREVVSECDKNIVKIRRNDDDIYRLREEIFVNLNAISDIIEYCKKKYEHRLNMINEFVHDIAAQYDNWNYETLEDPGLKQSVQMLDKLVPEDSDIRVWVDRVIESKVIKQALNRNKTLTQEQEEFMKMVKEFKYDDPFELSELLDYEEYLNEHPDQAVLRKRQ